MKFVIAQVSIEEVGVKKTDPRISEFTGYPHRVFVNKSVAAKKGLLIYLPASFDATSSADLFCNLAAANGYDVISLAYIGIDNMYQACEHSTVPSCFEDFHLELLEGKNYTPFIKIDSVDGLQFRLNALLSYLKQLDSRWSNYIDDSKNLKWDKMTWAGHSDAAGHVVAIAKHRKVNRVIGFSGPKDFSLHYYLPPIWLAQQNWKTDKSSIYCFSHAGDEYATQLEIWDSLGMIKYGKPVNVDQVLHPYNQSHLLTTNTNVSIGERHYATIMDTNTPTINKKSIFETTWKYLLDLPIQSVAHKDIAYSELKLFPNPVLAGQKVYHHLTRSILYEIYSSMGHKVSTQKGNFINTSGLKSGIFILKLYDANKNYISKLHVH